MWTLEFVPPLEETGHDVHLDLEVSNGSDHVERVLVRLGREGDDHPLDVERCDDLGELFGRAEDRQATQRLSVNHWCAVDEPDEVDAVLWMAQHLPRDEASDRARADDHRVLNVGDGPTADCASDSTQGGDADDRPEPDTTNRSRGSLKASVP